jgi:iron complex transport system ATP-binding protein
MAPITTRNLAVGYRSGKHELRLFEGLNLAIRPGELVCFMGPNGVGKSTLLKTLAGLRPPLSGFVSEANPETVAVVLTEKIQTPHVTVRELAAFGRYPYLNWHAAQREADEKIIADSLAAVRAETLADKKLSEVSDGQLQMAMIARALAQQTPALLLDEPTAHLDLNHRVDVMKLLRTLARQQHKAILVATHELDLALQTADRVWVAFEKNIVEGIPEDVVLSGVFDEVFQLKGFDLKTGKVQHEATRNKKIRLRGTGYRLLWTKNALEREGFEVHESEGLELIVLPDGWQAEQRTFSSLREVLAWME